MKLKQSFAWLMGLLVVCCACGHSRRGMPEPDESPETSVNALQPLPGADGARAAGPTAEAAGGVECMDAECPDLVLLGAPAPGCCQLDGSCGGRVQVAERTRVCVPPSVQESSGMLQETLSQRATEPFAVDRRCPTGVLDGSSLPGCCRAAGKCGIYTEAWTKSAAAYGFQLPAACLDAREAASLVDVQVTDAGPPRSCGAPAR